MSHPLQTYWSHLSSSAREALSLANRHSIDQGAGGRLRTRYVVAALETVRTEPLARLLSDIPADALPDPVPEHPDAAIQPLDERRPDLSPCVRHTLHALGSASGNDEEITPLDLFVDLVKHGGGSTVSNLRSHGITAERIEQLLDQQFTSDPRSVKRTDG